METFVAMNDLNKVRSLNDLPETDQVKTGIFPADYQVNLSDDIPDPEPVFMINGVLVSSPGNLLTLKAKQKSGKTFLVSCIVGSYFTGQYLEIEGIRTKKIAWIDTEQSLNQVHKIYRRTHLMSGFTLEQDNPDLRVYYASELDVPQRWELFERIAEDPENGIVIIDVATDLINDINDSTETKAAADRLQAIAKKNNILIIATIHENKKDSNATGHFGGSLQKKSEAVISLTKADGIFTVEATDTRHGDWPEFSFIIDTEGFPVSMEMPAKLTKTEQLELKIKGNMNHVLSMQRMKYSELVEKYSSHELCAAPTAKRHIKIARDTDIIKMMNDNYFILSKHDEEQE